MHVQVEIIFTDAEQESELGLGEDGAALTSGKESDNDGFGGGDQLDIGELVITAEDYHVPLNALLLAPPPSDPRLTLSSFSSLWGALVILLF